MIIEELVCKTNQKHVTVALSYDEVRDIANGLYHMVNGSGDKKEYVEIYGKCKFLFDMVKHGNIQPETVARLTDDKLSDEEINAFNAYIESNDMPTAFGNSDWCSVYNKIVGSKQSEYAEKQKERYRTT